MSFLLDMNAARSERLVNDNEFNTPVSNRIKRLCAETTLFVRDNQLDVKRSESDPPRFSPTGNTYIRELLSSGNERAEEEFEPIIVSRKSSIKSLFSGKVSYHIPDQDCEGDEEDKKNFRSVYKSAMKGKLWAINCLGVYYDVGYGRVKKDGRKAINWYTQAALQGYTNAQSNLGLLYLTGQRGLIPVEPTNAVHWLMRAADEKHAFANYHLGVLYWKGEAGLQKDSVEAFRRFKLAAKEGLGIAMNNVAVMYMLGDGIMKNPKKAVKWFERAVDCGVAESEHNLGMCYYTGTHVKQDDTIAQNFFRSSQSPNGIFEFYRTPVAIDRHDMAMLRHELLICTNHTYD